MKKFTTCMRVSSERGGSEEREVDDDADAEDAEEEDAEDEEVNKCASTGSSARGSKSSSSLMPKMRLNKSIMCTLSD
jgi:hypothetical protein